MTFDERAYDEWKLNPPDPEVVKECEECGTDIHKGEEYFDVDGTTLCTEKECFTTYALKVLDYAEKTA